MANQYLYDLTDSWSGGGTFDAIKMNVTDGGSNAASKLLNLQVGASPKFTVQKDGAVALTGAVTGATSINSSGTATFERLTVTKTVDNTPAIDSTDFEVTGTNTTSLVDLAGAWNTTGAPTAIKLNISETQTPASTSLLLDLQRGAASQFAVRRDGAAILGTDVFLLRDAANTLAQRNGTTTQAHRVYRTWTDASNYEALELAHATFSSAQYSILRTITAGSGADNINLVLSPSGTGAITAQLPDGGTGGGNARGTYAIDLQLERNANSQAATGNYSAVIGGYRNTASAERSSTVGGSSNVASATASFVGGGSSNSATGIASGTLAGSGNTASGAYSGVIAGLGSTASGANSLAVGESASSNKRGQISSACGSFAANGDAQSSNLVMRKATTDANASELFLNGTSERLTIPANTAWHADIRIIGRQVGGANHAIYHRKCCIERTVNATALVSTVQTIGTDIETDANWDVAITADDTNDALKIEVTGVASTNIRWVAEVQLVEVAYA